MKEKVTDEARGEAAEAVEDGEEGDEVGLSGGHLSWVGIEWGERSRDGADVVDDCEVGECVSTACAGPPRRSIEARLTHQPDTREKPDD